MFNKIIKRIYRLRFIRSLCFNINKFDVLVISPGGVATTTLMEHLSKFVNCNDPYDSDGFKHLPSVNFRKGPLPKIIFITGSNNDIESSLSRRGWFYHHGALLGNPLCELRIIPERIRRQWVLKNISKQLEFFTNSKISGREILIISYEEIWNHKDVIGKHCDINERDFVRDFPQKRQRNA